MPRGKIQKSIAKGNLHLKKERGLLEMLIIELVVAEYDQIGRQDASCIRARIGPGLV